MSVTAYMLLSPTGRITPEVIWPGLAPDKVGEKLAAFIKEGALRSGVESPTPSTAAQDESIKLWCYYRAKSEQYERLVGMPSTVEDSDEGSSSYLWSQIDAVRAERDRLLTEFEDSLETGGVSGGEYTVVQSLR